ncbi:MAG: histidinol-phosphate transaminase [Gammaproteobacteria bacterium]|nr:histidinol-phosphate transaminase [Gammaproteobacteria bacterium]
MSGDRVRELVRAEVLAMRAYHAPPADGMVKLDAMESSWQLPDALRRDWLARLAEVEINRYPDPTCAGLKTRIREELGIEDAHGLVLGNGSDELIQMIALLVGGGGGGGRGRVLLSPAPSFSMYPLIAAAVGAQFEAAPLREDFALDRAAFCEAIRARRPACVFLAHPNNPSGNCFDEEAILEALALAPGLVVIDEAYFSFCRRSFLPRLKEFPHLLVLRTFSKSGLAGLRLGMLIGGAEWTEQLEKIRLPYNINSLTQCSAAFYLEHADLMRREAEACVARREEMFAQLAEMPDVRAYPSEANFILFRVNNDAGADETHRRLRARGVLIKNLHAAGTPLENCLRVSIGAEAENRAFIKALGESLR